MQAQKAIDDYTQSSQILKIEKITQIKGMIIRIVTIAEYLDSKYIPNT